MAPVRKSSSMYVDCLPRGRGKPKRTWMEVIRMDMKKILLSEDLAHDRMEQRNIIHVWENALMMMNFGCIL